jgi:hypothetical protein
MTLTKRTAAAMKKYSLYTCLEAYEESLRGEGAYTISCTVKGIREGCTRQADAAINAGEEIYKFLEAKI